MVGPISIATSAGIFQKYLPSNKAAMPSGMNCLYLCQFCVVIVVPIGIVSAPSIRRGVSSPTGGADASRSIVGVVSGSGGFANKRPGHRSVSVINTMKYRGIQHLHLVV